MIVRIPNADHIRPEFVEHFHPQLQFALEGRVRRGSNREGKSGEHHLISQWHNGRRQGLFRQGTSPEARRSRNLCRVSRIAR